MRMYSHALCTLYSYFSNSYHKDTNQLDIRMANSYIYIYIYIVSSDNNPNIIVYFCLLLEKTKIINICRT